MAENTQPSQLLKDALIDEGSDDQASLLTGDAELLTLGDIINFINGTDLEKLTSSVKGILSEIARLRIKRGQPILPWNEHELIGITYPGIGLPELIW